MNTAKALFENCEMVSEVLKSLAHPTRLKLLCALIEKPQTVGELTAQCGASQSGTSQFLGRMKLEGVLESTREGNQVRYSIKNQNIKRLIKSLKDIYCS